MVSKDTGSAKLNIVFAMEKSDGTGGAREPENGYIPEIPSEFGKDLENHYVWSAASPDYGMKVGEQELLRKACEKHGVAGFPKVYVFLSTYYDKDEKPVIETIAKHDVGACAGEKWILYVCNRKDSVAGRNIESVKPLRLIIGDK